MKKKIIILLIIVVLMICFAGYKSYEKITPILEVENKVSLKNNIGLDKYTNYDLVRCDFGIFNTGYAFVGDTRSIDLDDHNYLISFYKMSRSNPFSGNWSANFQGSADIKNTTFPELLSMVKDDCSQFKTGQIRGDMSWSYLKHDPSFYEKTLKDETAEEPSEMEEIELTQEEWNEMFGNLGPEMDNQ